MNRMDAGGYAACFNHEQLALMCANSDRTIDELGAENKQLKSENAKLRGQYEAVIDDYRSKVTKLRQLCADLHILCYPQSYEWEVTDHTYEKYSPCELCEKAHGGKSPCASTSRDMSEECCKPFRAKVVSDRMRELGIEVTA